MKLDIAPEVVTRNAVTCRRVAFAYVPAFAGFASKVPGQTSFFTLLARYEFHNLEQFLHTGLELVIVVLRVHERVNNSKRPQVVCCSGFVNL